MKSKLFFIQLIVSVFCFVPLLLGTLLTIQLSTNPTNPFSNWQTTLYILLKGIIYNPSSDFVAQFLPAPLSQNLPFKGNFY